MTTKIQTMWTTKKCHTVRKHSFKPFRSTPIGRSVPIFLIRKSTALVPGDPRSLTFIDCWHLQKFTGQLKSCYEQWVPTRFINDNFFVRSYEIVEVCKDLRYICTFNTSDDVAEISGDRFNTAMYIWGTKKMGPRKFATPSQRNKKKKRKKDRVIAHPDHWRTHLHHQNRRCLSQKRRTRPKR